MFVLGLHGSPRKNGNTAHLLASFLAETEKLGARIHSLPVAEKKITPCQGCRICEREGFCLLKDDMEEIYPLLWRADIIVMATPVFFYGPPAQMKALIDRSQALWSRRYVYNLTDPGRRWRQGFLLSLGATRGGKLFDGVTLTAKYFFDAVGASFVGSLTYRQIEEPGDIAKHPTALSEVKEMAGGLIQPFLKRKKILFLCRENACRSQMASAFARYYAGDRMEVEGAGSQPAKEINVSMVETMKEKGIDMAFRRTTSIDEVLSYMKPDLIVTMGCKDECPSIPGVPIQDWDLPDPSDKPISFMREVRDEIEKGVEKLISST
ncbi:MAG: NAD(P)H-dependent oxidoreductase [Syntrophales bacterium]|nr:NAD(P)H-dependent oxidoreductase [Syntrophales bacterium]